MTMLSGIIVAKNLLATVIDTSIDDHALTAGEVDVLMAIRTNDGETTPSQLKERFAMTSQGITRRLDLLSDKRLIDRRAHPTDRRSVTLHLSDQGERIADEAIATMASSVLGLTEQTFTPDELDTLNHLLDRLNQTLRQNRT